MKKTIFTLFLIATLVIALTACAGGAPTSGDQAGKPQSTTTAPTTAPTEPTTTPAERITAAEAEDIALNNAGLSRDAVRFDRTELDKDDGRWEYEIEFYADGWEYSYDIHAETGKILSYDKEIWD